LRILITGISGKLGGYLAREGMRRGHQLEGWSGSWRGELFGLPVEPVDLADSEAVHSALARSSAEAIIHTAALSEVKECFEHPARADRINREGTGLLARWSAQNKRRFILVSTDMVFSGDAAPYAETDSTSPISAYGRSKVAAEREALAHPEHVVARVALMVGPSLTQRRGFFDFLLTQLRDPKSPTIRLFTDEWRTMLSLRVAAETLLDLLDADARGIYHVAGPERISRYELGKRTAALLGVERPRLEEGWRSEHVGAEARPKDLSLSCLRIQEALPGWHGGIFEEEIGAMLRLVP
jgi:dTDP-4-dehydrorhamnose reductase